MKVTVASVARAVVSTARIQPVENYASLAEAAVHVLSAHGLLRESRKFVSLVDRMWHKQEGVLSVKLTTTDGDAGPMKKQLVSIVESALNCRCILEEIADPDVLGGLMLAVGDERFDCTLRSGLDQLTARLTAPIPR